MSDILFFYSKYFHFLNFFYQQPRGHIYRKHLASPNRREYGKRFGFLETINFIKLVKFHTFSLLPPLSG